jgi:hypothetical protein
MQELSKTMFLNTCKTMALDHISASMFYVMCEQHLWYISVLVLFLSLMAPAVVFLSFVTSVYLVRVKESTSEVEVPIG